jgi:hypothetical protein
MWFITQPAVIGIVATERIYQWVALILEVRLSKRQRLSGSSLHHSQPLLKVYPLPYHLLLARHL